MSSSEEYKAGILPALFPDKTLAPDTLYAQITFFERVNPNAFKHLYGYCVWTCVDLHMCSCICTVCTHVWRPEANLEGQFSVTVTLAVCFNYMIYLWRVQAIVHTWGARGIFQEPVLCFQHVHSWDWMTNIFTHFVLKTGCLTSLDNKL